MAKYNVTFGKCNHTVEVELLGKHSDREYKLERMKHEHCPECAAKIKLEQIIKENAENAIKNEEKGLIQLKGSEKQVVWANKIRDEKIAKLEKEINKYTEALKTQDESKHEMLTAKFITPLVKQLEEVKTEEYASWFITNRY